MLLTLNDDCLYVICEYLNVVDHVQLFQTCERWRSIIENYYERKKNVTFGRELWSLDKERLRNFSEDFKSSIDHIVQEISIKNISIGKCDLLDYLPLSKVKALQVNSNCISVDNVAGFHRCMKCVASQLKTLELNYLPNPQLISIYRFPNVISLSMRGYSDKFLWTAEMFPKLAKLILVDYKITERSIWNFKDLIELELDPVNLTQNELKIIFRSVPLKKLSIDWIGLNFDGIAECQTLEELAVSRHFLNASLDELKKLKNFRKLTCTFNCQGRHICIPTDSNLVYHTLALCILHDLPLKNFDYVTKLKNLKNLKLFVHSTDLKHCFEQVDCNAALAVLKHCQNLRTLDIATPSVIAAHLLEQSEDFLHSLFDDRQEPLLMNCAVLGARKIEAIQLSEHHRKMEIIAAQKIKESTSKDFVKISIMEYDKFRDSNSIFHCDWKRNVIVS